MKQWIRVIEHFDFSYLESSGFYIDGFRARAAQRGYRFVLSRGRPPRDFPELLSKDPVERHEIGTVNLFRASTTDGDFFFCIDGRDRNDEYRLRFLERCRYYFKANYNEAVVNGRPELCAFRSRIFAAAPGFPVRPRGLSSYLPRPVVGADGWSESIRLFRDHARVLKRKTPSVNEFRAMRAATKTRDVVFVVPYYNQTHHQEFNEFRYEIMKALQSLPGADACVGFVGQVVPGKYAEFHVPYVTLGEHMRRTASSRVLVYVRGVHNCISYKFGEMLALGIPIVGQTLFNNTGTLLRYPFFDRQFAYDDPSAIAREVQTLLSDPQQQRLIAEANARTFDQFLGPEAAADGCLNVMERG